MTSNDTLITILQGALERQTKAAEKLAEDVPEAINRLQADVHSSMERTLTKTMRLVIVMAVICILAMAGLVGTQIVLTQDSLTVNSSQADEEPG